MLIKCPQKVQSAKEASDFGVRCLIKIVVNEREVTSFCELVSQMKGTYRQ